MNGPLRGKFLLDVIEQCLREGAEIEIDGLGSFGLDDQNQVIFQPNGRPRVFLAYADEDRQEVRKLYWSLHDSGFEPWMDEEKLVPGQNWPRAIEQAIELSDFFLGCFSKRSTVKRGHFQSELRYALDLASQLPLEDIFLVPVRLNDCVLPMQIAKKLQHVDMFPDWDNGVASLVRMMRRQIRRVKERRELEG